MPQSHSALTVLEDSGSDSTGHEEAQVNDEFDDEDLEVFQPSNQWQTLKPGMFFYKVLLLGEIEACLKKRCLRKHWYDKENVTMCFTFYSGQAVPRGSHVRLNLQTGQREAKLGEEQQARYLKDGQRYSNNHK